MVANAGQDLAEWEQRWACGGELRVPRGIEAIEAKPVPLVGSIDEDIFQISLEMISWRKQGSTAVPEALVWQYWWCW